MMAAWFVRNHEVDPSLVFWSHYLISATSSENQVQWSFIAMRYYVLILNRTFEAFVTRSMIYGKSLYLSLATAAAIGEAAAVIALASDTSNA